MAEGIYRVTRWGSGEPLQLTCVGLRSPASQARSKQSVLDFFRTPGESYRICI